jgi:hypothetical protein
MVWVCCWAWVWLWALSHNNTAKQSTVLLIAIVSVLLFCDKVLSQSYKNVEGVTKNIA